MAVINVSMRLYWNQVLNVCHIYLQHTRFLESELIDKTLYLNEPFFNFKYLDYLSYFITFLIVNLNVQGCSITYNVC